MNEEKTWININEMPLWAEAILEIEDLVHEEVCKLKKKNENLPDDDDWSALDCPKAVKEVEYGRVVRKSNVTAHETTLSEIII